VLVQLKPEHGAVGAVADGREDAYLRSYAQQVRSFGHQVIISFGQEMNGPWYSWGQGHVPPSLFVAAWRHMVTLFRAQGATNVTWLWDVNCELGKPLPVAPWWPGSAYVTWAGLDCYYSQPSDTFSSIFGPTIAAIRKVTSKPVLIAETAAGPDSGKQREAQIRGLFAGMEADHLLGFVWFDEKQDDGPYHQDWRLEDDPAALAVFKAAAKQYG
jgi:beta-mannanase